MDNNTLSLIYTLEQEYGSINLVPEDNLKLKILRERVNRVRIKKIPGKVDRYNDILLVEISRLLIKGYKVSYCANKLGVSYNLVNTMVKLYKLSVVKYYAVIDNKRYYADSVRQLREVIKPMVDVSYYQMSKSYYNHEEVKGMRVGMYKTVKKLDKNEAIELVNSEKERHKKTLRRCKHG